MINTSTKTKRATKGTLLVIAAALQIVLLGSTRVYSAPAKCFIETESTPQQTNCQPAGGNQNASRSYKNLAGEAVNGPEADSCYVLTSPRGSTHQVYTQQSDSQCKVLASRAFNYLPNDCVSEERGGPVDSSNCGILRYLVIFINVLSALAGIAIVGSIIYGGIQYSMAGSDPQKVSEAKGRIRNAIIALMFFLFMYALLNYLVPGGVLRG